MCVGFCNFDSSSGNKKIRCLRRVGSVVILELLRFLFSGRQKNLAPAARYNGVDYSSWGGSMCVCLFSFDSSSGTIKIR